MHAARTEIGPVVVVSDSVGFGGAEEYLRMLIRGIGPQEFVVVCPEEADPRLVTLLDDLECRSVAVPGLGRYPRPRALHRLVSTVRSLRPRVVHVNLTDQGDGLGTLFALSFLRRQMVATLHLVIPERARVKEVVSRAALRIPKLLICVSGANGAYAREAAANAVVIPNGVPAPSLAPDARAQLGLRDDAFVVGGIGRIDPQKGWDVLCRATPAILEQVPNAEFVVVGGGDAAWLEGVPGLENVRFVGPRENAAALLGAFDLLAMPSRYEGLGLVALEALAAGVPVVASAIRGLGDALADCGVQIEPERPDLLADVIVRLAKDDVERERLALAGSARQSAHFTEERMVEETRDAYVSVRRSR